MYAGFAHQRTKVEMLREGTIRSPPPQTPNTTSKLSWTTKIAVGAAKGEGKEAVYHGQANMLEPKWHAYTIH